MKKKKEITKKVKIMELVSRYPESTVVLMDHGFHCLGCVLAQFETLEQGALAHGMDQKKIEELVKEINSVIKIGSAKKAKEKVEQGEKD